MLGISLIVEPSLASRALWKTRHRSVRILPAWFYSFPTEWSKTRRQLAFLINAHQNANQKPIGSVPAYRTQCTLPPSQFTRPSFSIFRGSGSKTKRLLTTSGHFCLLSKPPGRLWVWQKERIALIEGDWVCLLLKCVLITSQVVKVKRKQKHKLKWYKVLLWGIYTSYNNVIVTLTYDPPPSS